MKIYCKRCDKELPSDDYYKDNKSKTGRRSSCKRCENDYRKKTRNDNLKRKGNLIIKKTESWSEEEISVLTKLRKNGLSYPVISSILNRTKDSVHQKSYKLGLTKSVSKEKDERFESKYEKFKQLGTLEKGNIGELKVFSKFLLEGFQVYTSITPSQEEDCLIRYKESGKLMRIQIKVGSYDYKDGRFRTSIVRKRVIGKNKGKRVRYENIDFYVVYIPVFEDFYIIPDGRTKNVTGLYLYPHREKLFLQGKRENCWEEFKNSFDLLKND